MTSRSGTPPGSAPFRGIDRAGKTREVDRNSWAGSQLVLATWDTIGSGTILTGGITFGAVFEGRPFFSYGVELQENETLVDGDYPFTACGVSEWRTTELADERAQPFYTGAVVWIRVDANFPYRLRFRFAFEGTVVRNREHIG